MSDDEALAAITSGDRRALARAITLVESTRPDHRARATELLARLPRREALRMGLSGTPGVGKSTFIEALGLHAIAQGHRVAVLAIDPSSARTGGSILGDKTRMTRLAQDERAYIRPSPTSGALGGVARRTREAALLAEAAGYDVIIIETVGVGQSETEVAGMVDMFLLMLLPGSGDELQGIKRGIVELADMIVVNKADGDLLAQAKRVQSDYAAALRMLRPSSAEETAWRPQVALCSALHGAGIGELWDSVSQFSALMRQSGALERTRAQQAKRWMWKEVRETLLERFCTSPRVIRLIAECEDQVSGGALTATQAAQRLLEAYQVSAEI